MKVFLQCEPWMGIGIKRVVRALELYRPRTVDVVATAAEADFLVLHVVGAGQRLVPYQRPYAVVQYCLRTTEHPSTREWYTLWAGARVVWSYYDLAAAMHADGLVALGNLLHQPLGVDPIFAETARASSLARNFAIGTSGYVAETEGVLEAAAATAAVGRAMFHLGPDLQLGAHVTHATGLTDAQVAAAWSRCDYVAGLRRIEGFELPVLEGLVAGARPICFDAPHYRQWFGAHAEYIPEGPADAVTAALTSLLALPPRRVLPDEIRAVRERFDWRRLVRRFWERVV